MSNVAIVYWSGTGNTEAMADFVAEGVEAKGGTATIIQAADFGAERVPEFDTFAFRMPRYGATKNWKTPSSCPCMTRLSH